LNAGAAKAITICLVAFNCLACRQEPTPSSQPPIQHSGESSETLQGPGDSPLLERTEGPKVTIKPEFNPEGDVTGGLTPHTQNLGVSAAQSDLTSPETTAHPQTPDVSPEASPETPQTDLPWLEWVVSHCRVDQLGPSDYAQKWLRWIRKERNGFDFMTADAPRPTLQPIKLPAIGSEAARTAARALGDRWRADPASHVVECYVNIDKRACEGCKPVHLKHGFRKATFIAYLPSALITEPSKVGGMLLLAPGGNGGHTRYFLTPIPNKHVTRQKRSGGLEIKKHADQFYEEHPFHQQTIIAATTNGGWSMANGHIEFLSHDLPKLLADVFLDGLDHKKFALGVEGISRGSRALVQALRKKPTSFNTVGLTCLHCGKHGPGNGYEPDVDLRNPAERKRWLKVLADRSRRGLFQLRFSVGNADPQWVCNKRLHSMLVEGGVLEDLPPDFTKCRTNRTSRPSPRWCDTNWDGFYLYDRMPHHYALLKPSWRPQLRWHLDTLSVISENIRAQ